MVLKFDGTPSISIEADPGLYTFWPESASGKTYLYSLLKARQMCGDPVVAYTYWDYKVGLDLDNLITAVHPKVVFVDRFGCFVQDEHVTETLLHASDTSIVLVDIKDDSFDCDIASIRMDREKIEVIG